MVYVICLVVIYIILYPLDHYFIVNNYVDFFLKAIVEFLIINVLLLLLFFKTNDFQSIYNRFIKNKWNMIKSKILKH